MFTKCYVIEYNSSNESMFEDLADAGFDYAINKTDNENYFEISFEVWSTREIQEIMHIMRWYV